MALLHGHARLLHESERLMAQSCAHLGLQIRYFVDVGAPFFFHTLDFCCRMTQ